MSLLLNVTVVSLEGRGVLIEGPPGSGKSSLVVIEVALGIDKQGDVIGTNAEERFSKQPLRTSGTTVQQTALEGVGDIAGGHVSAVMELHTRADLEGPNGAIV